MMALKSSFWFIVSGTLFVLLIATRAMAGVFDLPSFLEPKRASVGLETDLSLSNGTGAALNLKPRYGISDFFNVQGIVGTGFGDRRFRIGATLDLEIFPDVDMQPGIALPLTLYYMRYKEEGVASLFVSPMIYKTFHGKDGVAFTPFFAFPVGWNATSDHMTGFYQLALGTMFAPENMAHFKFTAEVGFNVYQANTYFAGGLTYYFSGYDWNRGGAPSGSEAPQQVGATISPNQNIGNKK